MNTANELVARIFTNPTWMRTAPCTGHTTLFFPEQHGNGTRKTVTQAKQICDTCPHRVRCLEYAIDNAERDGIWGGTTPQERRITTRNRRNMGWTVGRHRNQTKGAA